MAEEEQQAEVTQATNEPDKTEQPKPDSKPKRFKIINVLESMNKAPLKIPFLVDELLLEVAVSMLCAKPKTGKSTLAAQLAVAVAEPDRRFLGKATLQGDVLYLLLEGPQGAFEEHLRKMGYTGKHGTIHLVAERMPPKKEMGLKMLVEAIKDLPLPLRLVIVDPGAKLLRLLDSYAPEEVTTAIEELETIAKTHRLHLMFLTHGKKRGTDDPGDAAMGATAFRGGTDTNIFLLKNGTQRTIIVEQRWGVGLEATELSGWNEETQTVNLGESVETVNARKKEGAQRNTLKRIEKEIGEALVFEPTGLSQGELLELVTGKTETVLHVLNNMVAGGIVKQESDGKAIRYSCVGLSVEV